MYSVNSHSSKIIGNFQYYNGGGGGGINSGIHIPNLLTNYPMNLHQIKAMCTNITLEHICPIFVCISQQKLEVVMWPVIINDYLISVIC